MRDDALKALLVALFSPQELRIFVRGLPDGEAVLSSTPVLEGQSPDGHVASIVEALSERGRLGASFFEQLRAARPLRHDAIDLTAAAWAPLAAAQPPAALKRAGNPFAPFTTFVGREEELTALQAEQRSTILIGGRRVGKTALLGQLRVPGRRLFRANAGGWPTHSRDAVHRQLAALLGAPGHSQDALQATIRSAPACVLVIDEAERLLGHPWSDDLLAWLRFLDDNLPYRSRIRFILSGGPKLLAYGQRDVRGSPLFNTFTTLYLSPLSLQARGTLMDKLGRPLDRATLGREAGGHPWLLSQVLYRMWDGASLEGALEQTDLDELERHYPVWKRQLGGQGLALLSRIPAAGLPQAHFTRRGPMRAFRSVLPILLALCLVEVRDNHIYPGPALFLDWLREQS